MLSSKGGLKRWSGLSWAAPCLWLPFLFMFRVLCFCFSFRHRMGQAEFDLYECCFWCPPFQVLLKFRQGSLKAAPIICNSYPLCSVTKSHGCWLLWSDLVGSPPSCGPLKASLLLGGFLFLFFNYHPHCQSLAIYARLPQLTGELLSLLDVGGHRHKPAPR